jgi:hypothetical protein
MASLVARSSRCADRLRAGSCRSARGSGAGAAGGTAIGTRVFAPAVSAARPAGLSRTAPPASRATTTTAPRSFGSGRRVVDPGSEAPSARCRPGIGLSELFRCLPAAGYSTASSRLGLGWRCRPTHFPSASLGHGPTRAKGMVGAQNGEAGHPPRGGTSPALLSTIVDSLRRNQTTVSSNRRLAEDARDIDPSRLASNTEQIPVGGTTWISLPTPSPA